MSDTKSLSDRDVELLLAQNTYNILINAPRDDKYWRELDQKVLSKRSDMVLCLRGWGDKEEVWGDVNFLKNMGHLKRLSIVGLNIDDYDVLGELSQMEELFLNGITGVDIEVILAMRNLKKLSLTDIDADISFIGQMDWLEVLTLSTMSQVTDLDLLSNLKQLKILVLQTLNITNLEPISNLRMLEVIWLIDLHGIESFLPIGKLRQLQELRFMDVTPVTDVNWLTGMQQLELLQFMDDSGEYSIPLSAKDFGVFSNLYNLKRVIFKLDNYEEEKKLWLMLEEQGIRGT